MAEVDNIKRHAINFTGVAALFSFSTFPAWMWQGKLEDKTLNEEERCNRKEQGAKKEKVKIRVQSLWQVHARRGASRRKSVEIVGRRESKSEP